MLHSWALAEQGHGEEGVAQIQQELGAFRIGGEGHLRPHYLALLAEAYGTIGQVTEGLRVLDEALAVVEQTGERRHEAELYQLKGELLLQAVGRGGSAVTEAARCFRQALAIAHRQQTKALELRTAMSLGRLWQRQGKRATARQLLAPVYGWFTEGLDTLDLQEARALLEALER